jgi:PAS domain S-box-containing protein
VSSSDEPPTRLAEGLTDIEREPQGARVLGGPAFDALPHPVAILDELGVILEVNAAWNSLAAGNGFTKTAAGRGSHFRVLGSFAAGRDTMLGLESVLRGESESFEIECPGHAPNEERWFVLRATGFVDKGTRRILLMQEDVTPRRRTEIALRKSETRYRLLFENSPIPCCLIDVESFAILAVNDASVSHYGYSREELLAMTVYDIRTLDEAAALLEIAEQSPIGEMRFGVTRHTKKNGEIIDVELHANPVDVDGRLAYLVLINDVTARKLAERRTAAALATADLARRRLEATVHAMPVGVWITNESGKMTHANEAAAEIWRGIAPRGQSVEDSEHYQSWWPETGERITSEERVASVAIRTGKSEGPHLVEISRFDGTRGHVLASAAPIRDANGRNLGAVLINVDFTERQREALDRVSLLESLEFERNRLSAIFMQAPAFIAILRGPEHVFEMVNDACRDLVYGRDVVGKRIVDALPEIAEHGLLSILDRVLATGEPYSGNQTRIMLQPGMGAPSEERFVSFVFQPFEEADGTVSGIFVHGVEVTEQMHAAEGMRASEERYRTLVELSPDGIFMHSEGKVIFANTAAARILCADSPAQLLQRPILSFLPAEHHRLSSERMAALNQGCYAPPVSARWLALDRSERIVEVTSMSFTLAGKPAIQTVFRDSTQRLHLEAQLRQSQKMEAIGRLAGGIAHDFNNLLTVIKANVEFLLEDLDENDARRSEISEVRQAADCAADLTRQLLAFSRKQILQPKVLDLNTIVANVEPMLTRLIGKHILVETTLAASLGSVMADPGQIEQVLLNLVVNARDAMPNGGRVLLETSEVALDKYFAIDEHAAVIPGTYVMLAVSDTGTGMSAEVRARLFEPFFTTKPTGQGTGLGLSTVYGIVTQSGGHIRVCSELGEGTTFKVYLPRLTVLPNNTGEAIAVRRPCCSETVLGELKDGALR